MKTHFVFNLLAKVLKKLLSYFRLFIYYLLFFVSFSKAKPKALLTENYFLLILFSFLIKTFELKWNVCVQCTFFSTLWFSVLKTNVSLLCINWKAENKMVIKQSENKRNLSYLCIITFVMHFKVKNISLDRFLSVWFENNTRTWGRTLKARVQKSLGVYFM